LVAIIWFFITFKYFSSGVALYSTFGSQVHWASALLLLGLFLLGYFFGRFLCSCSMKSNKQCDRKSDYNSEEQDDFDFSKINTTGSDTKDNLKVVEWIGPKLEELLNNNNILSFVDLAQSNVSDLEEIIASAGNKFAMHNPKTWPEQAKLASKWKWDELKEYQNFLYRGLDG